MKKKKIPLLRNHLLEMSQTSHGFEITRHCYSRFSERDPGKGSWSSPCLPFAATLFSNLTALFDNAKRPLDGIKQTRQRLAWHAMVTGRSI
jgi:hypothetical protein